MNAKGIYTLNWKDGIAIATFLFRYMLCVCYSRRHLTLLPLYSFLLTERNDLGIRDGAAIQSATYAQLIFQWFVERKRKKAYREYFGLFFFYYYFRHGIFILTEGIFLLLFIHSIRFRRLLQAEILFVFLFKTTLHIYNDTAWLVLNSKCKI